jgi:creatinine amidohydrolase/Fe(II)-dependent formamide hydrolase-like protein
MGSGFLGVMMPNGRRISKRTAVGAMLLILQPGTVLGQAASPDPETPRPIEALNSVWIEELTWMEVRDALREGKGNALVAPVISFVPEGDFEPPSGHMRYPGTISVREETFRDLLTDIATSLKIHGFRHIVLMGDSGGNQAGMEAVADVLSAEWAGTGTTVHFIPEYYDNDRWKAWLENRGVVEVDERLHDDVRHTAIMMLVDPTTVRAEQGREAGLFSINGVALDPQDEILTLARDLVDYQAQVTVEAIRKALNGSD